MTGSRKNKVNGTPRSRERLRTVRKPVLTLLSLLALSLPIGACSTLTPATVTVGSGPQASKARCAGWRPITYSGADDTLDTIEQIRVHNQTGVNKRCRMFLK